MFLKVFIVLNIDKKFIYIISYILFILLFNFSILNNF